jgi:ketosteroid isomerase-like protein
VQARGLDPGRQASASGSEIGGWEMGSERDFGENPDVGRRTRRVEYGTPGRARPRHSMGGLLKIINLLLVVVALVFTASARAAEEPDHAIHEELRAVLRNILESINTGQYDKMLPYLTPDVEVTSVTQEVMSSRSDVSKYFVEWFGPTGYMKSMTMKLDADKLTEFSPDKNWGLVRGKSIEHYEAKDGDQFDFATRWTAVMTRGDDGKWRLRAIHFGTNHLDNPVLTKVTRQLLRYVYISSAACFALGLALGWWFGRRRARQGAAPA